MAQIVIPDYALALWKHLEKGMVVAHQQDLEKSADFKFLFENGLVRVVEPSDKLPLPARGVVLSEQVKMLMSSTI